MAWQGNVRQGPARRGEAWHGRQGMLRRVVVGYGCARRGWLRQGRHGLARLGLVWLCKAWFGRLGKAGLESQKGVDVEVGRNGRKAVFIFSQQVQSTC